MRRTATPLAVYRMLSTRLSDEPRRGMQPERQWGSQHPRRQGFLTEQTN